MKKLALLLPAMRMGGAEKIAINFLKDLTKYYEVTLILNKKEGELLKLVPRNVEVLEDRLLSFTEVLKRDLKRFKIGNLFKDAIYYFKVKFKRDKERNYRYLVGRTPSVNRHFDVAIGYVANVSTQIFCLADRISANKKIAWIHGETTELKDVRLYQGCYKSFDKIFAVSEVTRRHFVEKFPSCESLTSVYYNPINVNEIVERSKDCCGDEIKQDALTVVSVGRVTPEKGFDMLPTIVAILKDRGLRLQWYLVGDGSELVSIKRKTQEMGLSNDIIFTGTKENPYPYVRQCDIYVQPSYEEGYSTTICEAGILGKAVIGTTTSGGICEQVVEGESALLASPTPEDIANKIEYLAKNPQEKQRLEENIKKIDFSHTNEIYKLLNI